MKFVRGIFSSSMKLNRNDNVHSDLFHEKTSNTMKFNWKEFENKYVINVTLLVQINPQNLKLYISRQQLVIETYIHPEIETTHKYIIDEDKEKSEDSPVIKPITLCLRKAFNLPRNIDVDDITATLVDDVLTIFMPKITSETCNDPQRQIKNVHVSTHISP